MAILKLFRESKPLRLDLNFQEEPLTLFVRELTDEESLLDSYETSYAFAQHATARAFALNLIRRIRLAVTGWNNVLDEHGEKVEFDVALVFRMLTLDKTFANALSDALNQHFQLGDESPKKFETPPPGSSPGDDSTKPTSTPERSNYTEASADALASAVESESAAEPSPSSPPNSSKT